AGHAMACVGAWFFAGGDNPPADWEHTAAESVSRAVDRAPNLAETHVAAGAHATQHSDYASAVRSFSLALRIAPTCADAHDYLGRLECEAEPSESGAKRLKLAHDLDPELPYPLTCLARHHALHGRYAECDALLDEVEVRATSGPVLSGLLRAR